jgi:predicted nucleic acid-binding protein
VNGLLVSNTGPLIALAGINRLDILQSLFQEVLVPGEVHQEIIEGGSHGLGLEAYHRANWLQIQPQHTGLDPLLIAVLDKGEAAVIQLARTRQADYLLMDERKGRKIARSTYGLSVVGTAGILVEAKKQALLDRVSHALAQMRENGYYIHDAIVELALQRAGENG